MLSANKVVTYTILCHSAEFYTSGQDVSLFSNNTSHTNS